MSIAIPTEFKDQDRIIDWIVDEAKIVKTINQFDELMTKGESAVRTILQKKKCPFPIDSTLKMLKEIRI